MLILVQYADTRVSKGMEYRCGLIPHFFITCGEKTRIWIPLKSVTRKSAEFGLIYIWYSYTSLIAFAIITFAIITRSIITLALITISINLHFLQAGCPNKHGNWETTWRLWFMNLMYGKESLKNEAVRLTSFS